MSPRLQAPQLHRRQVLQGATAALAAPLLLKSHPLLASPKSTAMRMGLVTYLWGKDMSLGELLASCEKSGFLGVELRTEHKHGVEPTLSKAQRLAVRKRFADSPVELVGYGSNCEYHSEDPAKLASNIEQTKAYIQLMHDCGGTGVKVKPNGFPNGVPREKTIEQIGKALNEVAEYGAKYGQKIRVEVHGKGTSELPVVRDIFEVADHKNVYVCWNCNAEDLAGDGLEANFRMVQDRFGDTVHVRELNVGDYPYPELMQLLLQMDYAGWILLEARTDPADKVAAMIEQRQVFQQLTEAS
jgi:sugar phosphate isomerase/epimerase